MKPEEFLYTYGFIRPSFDGISVLYAKYSASKGHYVEFGVYQGQSINYLASLNKKLHFTALIALKDYLNSGSWDIKS